MSSFYFPDPSLENLNTFGAALNGSLLSQPNAAVTLPATISTPALNLPSQFNLSQEPLTNSGLAALLGGSGGPTTPPFVASSNPNTNLDLQSFDPFYKPNLSPVLSGNLPSAQQLQQQLASGNYLNDLLQGFTGTGNSAGAPATSQNSSFLNVSLGRIGVFLLGLIFIAGGIFLFGKQPISEVVGTATRAAVAV